uniref:Small ribosomal subunit protein uS15 N-terminal domain-containing protein n=1 Tax=Oryctolagus cuniculus TaxID=9986 RepID=A0A5F9CA25_RABIT
MGHMLALTKGLSQWALPYCHCIPTWLDLASSDVKEIYKLATEHLTPLQVGCRGPGTWSIFCCFPRP